MSNELNPDEKLRLAEEKLAQAEQTLREAETKLRQAEELEKLALEDAVTGLPNLHLLRRQLDFHLEQMRRHQRQCGLLAIDLDRFQVIIDTHGVAFANQVLCGLAARLKTLMRDSDLLARVGEDRFVILLSEVSGGLEQARLVGERILDMISEPLLVGDAQVVLSASAGLGLFPEHGQTVPKLLQEANLALSAAKRHGRQQLVSCSDGIYEETVRSRELADRLSLALERGHFTLLYQPIVELHGQQVVGLEALLRWHDPERGEVPPAEFIPVADQSGQIVPIGEWVLEQASSWLQRWQQQGLELFIDVNLSPRQLLQADLAGKFLEILAQRSVVARDLLVDIPERAVSGDRQTLDCLQRLSEVGIRVAIDDFGTDTSRLESIRIGRSGVLKLASEFVAGLPDNRDYLRICVAVIKLADSLNMQSLAEGVETEEQFDFLRRNGCRLAQGYYFSAPVEAERVAELVRSRLP